MMQTEAVEIIPAASISYNYGVTVTVLDNIGTTPLTKPGYTFAGWNTAADYSGTSYASGATFAMPASITTLYAVWTINSYSVSYDANGANSGSVPAADTYNYNTTATVRSNSGSLARTGYTFVGWNTLADGNGTSHAEGTTFTMPTGNVTLYAVWTVNSYTVSYDANGGSGDSPAASTSYNYEASVTVLGNTGTTPLTKSGYAFAGWNTLADGSGTSYSSGNDFTMPAGNTTLYAVWTINSYTVSYDANGANSGSVPVADTYNYNTTATVRSNSGSLARTGYTFAGWNTAMGGNGTDYAAGATFTMPAGNTTLYAVWTVNSYTVSYDANEADSGSAPVADTYNYNATATVRSNSGSLARTGYTFAGWNTAADGSGTSYDPGNDFTMPAGNTTLYAVWTINSYMVNYDGNGSTGGAVPTNGSLYSYKLNGYGIRQ